MGNALIFNGGGLQFNGAFDPSVRTMTFESGGATLDTQANNITLANAVGNNGTGGLTKKGSGKLTLGAINPYRGDTIVDGGILEITGGISSDGTALIDVLSGTAVFSTTDVNKGDLDILTVVGTTLEAVDGTHFIGKISGNGMTLVDSGASLTAASITQGTLAIGGARANGAVAVPEPSLFVLIGGAIIFLAFINRGKGRRG
jgi:autotransporter-associated beta strand protein